MSAGSEGKKHDKTKNVSLHQRGHSRPFADWRGKVSNIPVMVGTGYGEFQDANSFILGGVWLGSFQNVKNQVRRHFLHNKNDGAVSLAKPCGRLCFFP
jgi:hypothetical protein